MRFFRRFKTPPEGGWERPIDEVRRHRWNQVSPVRIGELPAYRLPIQVCPRGCEHHELARRDLLTRTCLSGRVEMHNSFTFETTNCPKCGTGLVRECARCENLVFAPVADRCQFCGLPQPWAADRRAAAERASVRLWDPADPKVHDPAWSLYKVDGRGEIFVVEGDLVRLAVEAVVSNDDVDGQMWAETARAIKNAAGEEVEQRAQDGKPYRLGEGWITAAGNLAAPKKNIIHVASMNRRGESTVESVRSCLVSTMDIAFREDYESIGLSAFGSGPSAINKPEWYRTFAETTVPYLTGDTPPPNPDAPKLAIVLVLLEPQSFRETFELLSDAVSESHRRLGRPSWGAPSPLPPG
ncbi:MAG TPA: macro domain-containing protein [Solirubrobacterales bacterium]|nr:macro domain-containing protein [Solirubrobacterales bacterium]